MTVLTPELVDRYRRLDSASVSNAIETFDVRLRNEGFADGRLRCLFDDLPPVIGHAVTARIRCSAPPPVGHSYHDRTDWWNYILTVPAPRVVVVEDADERPGVGAFVGEVHANILRALGCVGYATNGIGARSSTASARLGFQLFASGLGRVARVRPHRRVRPAGDSRRAGRRDRRHPVRRPPRPAVGSADDHRRQIPAAVDRMIEANAHVIALCRVAGVFHRPPAHAREGARMSRMTRLVWRRRGAVPRRCDSRRAHARTHARRPRPPTTADRRRSRRSRAATWRRRSPSRPSSGRSRKSTCTPRSPAIVKSINVDVGDRVHGRPAAGRARGSRAAGRAAAGRGRRQARAAKKSTARRPISSAPSRRTTSRISARRGWPACMKARPNLVAQQDIDEATGRDRVAEAQVATAKAALAVGAASSSRSPGPRQSKTQTLFDYARITAPFAGVITHRYADTGAMIQAGTSSQTPGDADRPAVAERSAAPGHSGAGVGRLAHPPRRSRSTSTVAVARTRPFTGTVARFADRLDTDTRTMRVEVDVPNPTLRARARACTPTPRSRSTRRSGVLVAPVQAIDRTDDGRARARRRPRRQARGARRRRSASRRPDRVEVTSGPARGRPGRRRQPGAAQAGHASSTPKLAAAAAPQGER